MLCCVELVEHELHVEVDLVGGEKKVDVKVSREGESAAKIGARVVGLTFGPPHHWSKLFWM